MVATELSVPDHMKILLIPLQKRKTRREKRAGDKIQTNFFCEPIFHISKELRDRLNKILRSTITIPPLTDHSKKNRTFTPFYLSSISPLIRHIKYYFICLTRMNKDANMDAKRGKMWENGDRTTLTH